jgi:hypothetical protein
MGFKDIISSFFKKPRDDEPPVPENPPQKVDDTFSKQDLNPPPKIENFNEEIPDLPDLDIPEELGGVDSFLPSDSKPHPGVEPKLESKSPLPELPPFQLEHDIDFGEQPSDEISPMPSPLPKPVEPPKHVPKVKPKPNLHHLTTTYQREGYEYMMEHEFTKIYHDLDDISNSVSTSPRYKNLLKYHNKKEKKMLEFKKLMHKVYTELDEVQKIIFEKGE